MRVSRTLTAFLLCQDAQNLPSTGMIVVHKLEESVPDF